MGNAATFVAQNLVLPIAAWARGWAQDRQLGVKFQALVEVTIENLLYTVDPKRREREQAARSEAREREQADAAKQWAAGEVLEVLGEGEAKAPSSWWQFWRR